MSDFKDWVFVKDAGGPEFAIIADYAEMQVSQTDSSGDVTGRTHTVWHKKGLGTFADLRGLLGALSSELGVLFDPRRWYVDPSQDGVIEYSYMVDEENGEATDREIQDWKDGLIQLQKATVMVHIRFAFNPWVPSDAQIRNHLGMR